MRFGLLGPLEVRDDEEATVELGGRQPRLLLAVLVASAGRSVSVDALIEAVWGDEPSASAPNMVQSYVSRLRRRLGASTIVLDDAGYRLTVDDDQVDHRRFEARADRGRALLDSGDAAGARQVLLDGERLWRGPALVEFADLEFATGLATRLDQGRLAALEDRFEADLLLGRAAAVVGELGEAVAEHPLRERLQAQHALALYRAGRQAEALRSIADAGRLLRDELGIEPGRGLTELEAQILVQDPALDVVVASEVRAASVVVRGPDVDEVTVGPPMVGRKAELEDLRTAFAEVATGARFVVLEGEPGIGKTRTADELRAWAVSQGAVGVWGRSDEGGAAPALWPWLTPLRALSARVDAVPAPVAELLAGEAPVASGGVATMQFERFEAVETLLEQAAAEQPVVVLIDDLQWADSASLELLAFLARRLGPGVLVVGTVRHLEVGRNDGVTDALAAIARSSGHRRLVLRGLRPAETAEVLDVAAGRSLPPTIAQTIHDRAEGNPFYAIELARLADEEGGLGGEVPGTVGDVIRRRLARLPAPTVELLAVGAVVGRDVDLTLLAAAADGSLEEVLDGLDPAVVHRLLVEVPERPGTLRFSHALVREVLLDDLTTVRRARLHLRVADAIEAGGAGVDEAEILAEHLWQAAPVGDSRRGAEALEAAAEVALRRVAYGAAEELLAKAVQLRRASSATVDEQEAELAAIVRLLEVARALRYFQGAAEDAVMERAKELAERTGHQDDLLDILWFEWSAMATSCQLQDTPKVRDTYRRLTLDDDRPEVRSFGHEVRGVRHWYLGQMTEACDEFETAIELIPERPAPGVGFAAEKWTVTHAFWLWTRTVTGRITPAESYATFDRLVAGMDDQFEQVSLCGFAATLALALGDWDEAERFASIGTDTDFGSQFSFWYGQSMMHAGIAQVRKGRIEEGLATFDEGKALYRGIGARSGVPTFEASLAIVLSEQGAAEEAERRVATAREQLQTDGERWNEPIVLIAEAASAGDVNETKRLLAMASKVARTQGATAFGARSDVTGVMSKPSDP